MSVTTAELALELLSSATRGASDVSLTFYGGEPLLNAEVVYWSMRRVRQMQAMGDLPGSVHMTLLTNGTLVDEKTLAALSETRTQVAVSLDGPRELHDIERKAKNGSGSFVAAMRGYRLLQGAGLEPGVSCTLSASNVGRIDDVLTFILDEASPSSMGFNILLPRSDGPDESYSYHFATAQIIKAFSVLRQRGIYEDRVMRRMRPFTTGVMHIRDCLGVGGQIVVTPEGMVGPCQAIVGMPGCSDYFPDNIAAMISRIELHGPDSVYESAPFREWRYRIPLNMKQCIDCHAIGVCGGGCPYAALLNHGSIWTIDERVCEQAKQILEWMIWETEENLRERIRSGPGFSGDSSV